jgi:NADH:ubiquinone oxidoreductase subunit E
MCAYYEDGKERIKKGDIAFYLTNEIEILEAKHLKADKMMAITYLSNGHTISIQVPYKTVMDAMELRKRKEKQEAKTVPRINEMGQEIVEGFACKPKDFDPERPIMHYKTLLLLCEDERCAKAGKVDKAVQLREILKEMGLNKGKNRIKISRTGCYGACRFRQVCQVTENTKANGNPDNNALWLRHTHTFDEDQWREIFTLLSTDESLEKVLDSKHFIPMKVYE